MLKTCAICGHSIKNDEDVLVGMRAVYKEIPSRVSFAIQPTEQYVFINHYACDVGEDPGDPEYEDLDDMPPEESDNERN